MSKKVVRTLPVKNMNPNGRARIGIQWPFEGAVVDKASLTNGQWRELNADPCIGVDAYDPEMCEHHVKAIHDFDLSRVQPSEWDTRKMISRAIARRLGGLKSKGILTRENLLSAAAGATIIGTLWAFL